MHGIQPCKGKGVVTISVTESGNRVRIAVRDTGHGISEEVVSRVARNEMPGNKIGLLNVHHRVKLLYGDGLNHSPVLSRAPKSPLPSAKVVSGCPVRSPTPLAQVE